MKALLFINGGFDCELGKRPFLFDLVNMWAIVLCHVIRVSRVYMGFTMAQ